MRSKKKVSQSPTRSLAIIGTVVVGLFALVFTYINSMKAEYVEDVMKNTTQAASAPTCPAGSWNMVVKAGSLAVNSTNKSPLLYSNSTTWGKVTEKQPPSVSWLTELKSNLLMTHTTNGDKLTIRYNVPILLKKIIYYDSDPSSKNGPLTINFGSIGLVSLPPTGDNTWGSYDLAFLQMANDALTINTGGDGIYLTFCMSTYPAPTSGGLNPTPTLRP